MRTVKLSDIQIRDPFVLPVEATGDYYLYGSTDRNVWKGPGTGFDCYRSRDLAAWEGPIAAFRPPARFWATTQFWAPEVHAYRGRYYMFASFKAEGVCRGTQILAADKPEGPYVPWSDGPVTPRDWECLDGTLHVDETGAPWMVFCHEWVQVGDGTMEMIRLSEDLRCAQGQPELLFRGSSAPWVRPIGKTEAGPFVTDGPFLHRTGDGTLLMLWSSQGAKGYAMGLARSSSGTVRGPWVQEPEPLWANDGGHGMIFRAFDGQLYLTLHQPNKTPHERTVLRKLESRGDQLRLVEAR